MSDAKVTFENLDHEDALPGQEAFFSFRCPKYDRPCGGIPIAGRVPNKRDGQNQNGGIAQWDWDGNRANPTFSPSINCGSCWHGYIRNGRTVDCQNNDEPEIARVRTQPRPPKGQFMRTVHLLLVSAVAVFITSPAAAADKLSVRQSLEVLQGLRALDGHQVIAKQQNGETVVTVPWEFGNSVLRLKIANNLAILNQVEKSSSDARSGIIKEILKGKPGAFEVKPNTPEWEEFSRQFTEMLEQPATGTQDLAKIRETELKLDKNEIPPTVLTAIAPIREP